MIDNTITTQEWRKRKRSVFTGSNSRRTVREQRFIHYAKWTNNYCAIIVMSCSTTLMTDTQKHTLKNTVYKYIQCLYTMYIPHTSPS